MVVSGQVLNNTFSLSQCIKGYLEKVHEPLLKDRGNLRKLLFQEEEVEENLRVESETKLKSINEEIEKKWFSLEHIMRELYYLGKYTKKEVREDHLMLFKDLAYRQISNGQPFELIDGDTLQFISDVYD